MPWRDESDCSSQNQGTNGMASADLVSRMLPGSEINHTHDQRVRYTSRPSNENQHCH
jgi:hypothetical protein